jgi:hypothetical protein
MSKKIVSLLGAATMVVTVAATATETSAQWRGRGWGWGPGIAAGVIGGAVIAGAIIASRPPGYVVYEGYPQPVYAPGCYWASQPVYDAAGRVVGYTGQPVQVCPGYSGPPPGNAGPPPGYAGGPPAGGAPQGYAGGPPAGDPVASCMQRFRSYDPKSGTYLGNDGQRHSLSVSQLLNVMPIGEADRSKARRPASSTLRPPRTIRQSWLLSNTQAR